MTLNDAHPIKIHSLNSTSLSSMQQPITSLYSYDWHCMKCLDSLLFWLRNVKMTDSCLHFCYSFVLVTVLGVQQYKQVNREKHIDLFVSRRYGLHSNAEWCHGKTVQWICAKMQSEWFQQSFSHVQRKLMHESLFYIKSNLNSTIMRAKSLKILEPFDVNRTV